MKISLIGGTGLLGRAVSEGLTTRGIDFISAGRSAEGPGKVKVDIATGEGIEAAIADSDTVMYLASNPRRTDTVDVAGALQILPIIGDRHLIYMSIVGVDRHPLAYYRAKYQIEQMIVDSTLHYSIVRATQFHDLIAFILQKVGTPPLCVLPRGFVFQPVDTDEVARHLIEVAQTGPGGRLSDFAGPEVIVVEDLARSYMTAIGKERPVLKVPIPGKVARAFREGVHTNPDRAMGQVTWDTWLDRYRQGQQF